MRDIARSCGGCGANPYEDCDPNCAKSHGRRPRRPRSAWTGALLASVTRKLYPDG